MPAIGFPCSATECHLSLISRNYSYVQHTPTSVYLIRSETDHTPSTQVGRCHHLQDINRDLCTQSMWSQRSHSFCQHWRRLTNCGSRLGRHRLQTIGSLLHEPSPHVECIHFYCGEQLPIPIYRKGRICSMSQEARLNSGRHECHLEWVRITISFSGSQSPYSGVESRSGWF